MIFFYLGVHRPIAPAVEENRSHRPSFVYNKHMYIIHTSALALTFGSLHRMIGSRLAVNGSTLGVRWLRVEAESVRRSGRDSAEP